MFTSVPHVLLMRSKFINLFSKNSMMFFPGVMKRCPGIDPDIVVHEIKTYPTLNPFDRDFSQYIHTKLLLLNSKLKNFLKSVLFILWL
jgi:hypothetical protein